MNSLTVPDTDPYDAVLLLSFGGPEAPQDVVPFLENVTRGRGIPRERLEEVGQHYFLFGGRSPINDQNRDLIAAIREDFSTHGIDLPVYWGNRNWDPYLVDAVRAMAADGVRRAAVFTTSAYSSYSSCRQYRENLADAVAEVDAEVGAEVAAETDAVPRLDRLRQYFNHPGFVEPVVDAVVRALAVLDEEGDEARIVFVTHSVPEQMAATSGPPDAPRAYERQHRSVAREVADRVAASTGRERDHDLVYCSRSGSPTVAWLEPDVNDHLEDLAARGTRAVVLVPVGFVSDHMEVIYDLDTEALDTCKRLGLRAERAATPGVDPRFVAMVRELVLERAAHERARESGAPGPDLPAVGDMPAWRDVCAAGCCPNPRAERPALCGA